MAGERELAVQIVDAVERRFKRRERILAVFVFVLAALMAYFAWRCYRVQPVVLMSQQQAETSDGVRQAAAVAHVPLTEPQAREVAVNIKTAPGRPPDREEVITGQDLTPTVNRLRLDAGADFAVVTDPAKPTEKPAVKPDAPVSLNVFNIKAFPKHLLEMSIGLRGADVAYLYRIDVPRVPLLLPKGAVGYAGPFVRMEYNGQVDGGLRLTIPY